MASKVRKKTSKASLRSSGRDKNRFSLYTKLLVTGETFRARGVFGEMKIGALKGCLEFTIGIPQNLQRISYLDEGDLLDKSDVKSNDIVPGGTLHVRLWPMWNDLIEAVASNDIDKVFSLGVTQATEYKTPNSEYMSRRSKKAWLADRAFVALCVASHRGHADLVKKLIKSGANVNTTTPLGRTPLHLASSQGHGQIVDALLQNGADIDAVDCNGMTSLMIAEQFEHKGCGRHLFLFRWQQRAKKMQPALQRPLMAHQMFDSAYPIWKNGKQCQLYVTKLEPPGEFEGTRIDSKPYKPFPDKSFRGRYGSPVNLQVVKTSSNGEKLMPVPLKQEDEMNTNLRTADHVPPNFDDWLKQLKNKEHRIRLRKIRSEERRKQEEEDRKREESEKNQSYESWLAQQEMDRGKDARLTPDQRQQDLHSLGSYQRPSSNKKGALREYLESLADRRGASSYSDWLIKKEIEMLDSVEARPVIKTK